MPKSIDAEWFEIESTFTKKKMFAQCATVKERNINTVVKPRIMSIVEIWLNKMI